MEAVRAAAQHIAESCHMDIMGFSYMPDDFYSSAIVVYVNNGASIADIKHFMASEVDQKGKAFWFLQDIEERACGLDFLIATKPMNEGWE